MVRFNQTILEHCRTRIHEHRAIAGKRGVVEPDTADQVRRSSRHGEKTSSDSIRGDTTDRQKIRAWKDCAPGQSDHFAPAINLLIGLANRISNNPPAAGAITMFR